ncbi:MAG: hypothetical protein Q4A15_12835 [Prevotellaceae bacterium]|nr:hypothetical protein [Prevotellaceae bacterium]
MIFKEEERIHIPPKWIAIWAIAFAIIFFIGIAFEYKRASSYKYLRYEDGLDTTAIINPIAMRGGLFYDDFEFVVNCSSKLVENNGEYDNWNYYRKSNPSYHNLADLPGPYLMFKPANNDTIVVIKDGYVLKFILPNPEDQKRDFPPKNFSEFKQNVKKAYKERYE